MNKLYRLFQSEKKRNPDLTVFYKDNNGMKHLSYTNNEGTLTVRFGKNGKEDFYFKKANEKGFGEKVYHREPKTNGEMGSLGLMEDGYWNLPERFMILTEEWQFHREIIGIDEQ